MTRKVRKLNNAASRLKNGETDVVIGTTKTMTERDADYAAGQLSILVGRDVGVFRPDDEVGGDITAY